MSGELKLRFLSDGGQTVERVAGDLAAFIEAARATLEVATYDFHLGIGGEAVARALQAAAARGVAVRIVDHDDPVPRTAPAVPRPSAPTEYVDALGLPVKAVADRFGLMHHKYVLVDRRAVWTGSLNWTDDSFTRQENAVATIDEPQLAAAYLRDFEQLWARQLVEGTGDFDTPTVQLTYEGATVSARPFFCPGRGVRLASAIAARIGSASQRVLVCSPVLTSGPILGALADLVQRGVVPLTGVVDGTQMRDVLRQWQQQASWKPEAFRHVAAGFACKRSTPWPAHPHDYLHAKLVVADDWAFLGSFNHSRSGEENAENVLMLHGAEVADRIAAFIEQVVSRYPVAAGEAGW